jgi:uncharacterized membrane protein YfcA
MGSVSLLLFGAALLAGALNAVAGGGSFITLPTLLYAGIAPVSANATSTFGVWPASIASAVAYRREIKPAGRRGVLLGAASLLGGGLGGLLLVRTSDTSFMRLLPWLMLLAAGTFTFGNQLSARIRREPIGGRSRWALLLQLAIATYGGYFGGGMGIMMLATFTAAGMTDIHEMNGLKSVLGVAINGVALVEFVAHGAIAWAPGLVMVAGGIIGGYAGAALARRLDRRHVRTFVIAIGWIMTTYFFVR